MESRKCLGERGWWVARAHPESLCENTVRVGGEHARTAGKGPWFSRTNVAPHQMICVPSRWCGNGERGGWN